MYVRKKYVNVIKIIVCILIIIIIAVCSSENLRGKFSDFIANDNGGSTYSDGGVNLGYVPTGFEPIEIQNLKGRIFLRFASGEFYFDVSVNGINGNYSIDTENAVVEQIKINNLDGIYSSNENVNILVWYDDEFVYRITANISKDEIIKIAENLQIDDM